jgi:RNA polymerase sigma-70 factor (ECF subfamily)
MSDELVTLMQRYVEGDATAFEELYTSIGPAVHRYLLRMARDRAVADDLLQITFLKVHRARSSYIRGAAPLPWIYAIAHRTFLDEARRRRRARVRVAASDHLPEVPADLQGREAATAPEPRDHALAAKIAVALERLPETQRQAVTLVKIEGKSMAEAAEIAQTTPGAMKLRAHRAYQTLRKLLATAMPDGAADDG